MNFDAGNFRPFKKKPIELEKDAPKATETEGIKSEETKFDIQSVVERLSTGDIKALEDLNKQSIPYDFKENISGYEVNFSFNNQQYRIVFHGDFEKAEHVLPENIEKEGIASDELLESNRQVIPPSLPYVTPLGEVSEQIKQKLKDIENRFAEGRLSINQAKAELSSVGAGPLHTFNVKEENGIVRVDYMVGNAGGHMSCPKDKLPEDKIDVDNIGFDISNMPKELTNLVIKLTRGLISQDEFINSLRNLGASDIRVSQNETKFGVNFTEIYIVLGDSQYKIRYSETNSADSVNNTDNIGKTDVYTYEQLKSENNLTDSEIQKYFIVAFERTNSGVNNRVYLYTINTRYGNSLSEVLERIKADKNKDTSGAELKEKTIPEFKNFEEARQAAQKAFKETIESLYKEHPEWFRSLGNKVFLKEEFLGSAISISFQCKVDGQLYTARFNNNNGYYYIKSNTGELNFNGDMNYQWEADAKGIDSNSPRTVLCDGDNGNANNNLTGIAKNIDEIVSKIENGEMTSFPSERTYIYDHPSVVKIPDANGNIVGHSLYPEYKEKVSVIFLENGTFVVTITREETGRYFDKDGNLVFPQEDNNAYNDQFIQAKLKGYSATDVEGIFYKNGNYYDYDEKTKSFKQVDIKSLNIKPNIIDDVKDEALMKETASKQGLTESPCAGVYQKTLPNGETVYFVWNPNDKQFERKNDIASINSDGTFSLREPKETSKTGSSSNIINPMSPEVLKMAEEMGLELYNNYPGLFIPKNRDPKIPPQAYIYNPITNKIEEYPGLTGFPDGPYSRDVLDKLWNYSDISCTEDLIRQQYAGLLCLYGWIIQRPNAKITQIGNYLVMYDKDSGKYTVMNTGLLGDDAYDYRIDYNEWRRMRGKQYKGDLIPTGKINEDGYEIVGVNYSTFNETHPELPIDEYEELSTFFLKDGELYVCFKKGEYIKVDFTETKSNNPSYEFPEKLDMVQDFEDMTRSAGQLGYKPTDCKGVFEKQLANGEKIFYVWNSNDKQFEVLPDIASINADGSYTDKSGKSYDKYNNQWVQAHALGMIPTKEEGLFFNPATGEYIDFSEDKNGFVKVDYSLYEVDSKGDDKRVEDPNVVPDNPTIVQPDINEVLPDEKIESINNIVNDLKSGKLTFNQAQQKLAELGGIEFNRSTENGVTTVEYLFVPNYHVMISSDMNPTESAENNFTKAEPFVKEGLAVETKFINDKAIFNAMYQARLDMAKSHKIDT